eukprot:1675267-Amphidinium_carterae.1
MSIQSAQTQKMWLLKGFLQQRKFPSEFRERVLRYVHTAIGSRKDMIQREELSAPPNPESFKRGPPNPQNG